MKTLTILLLRVYCIRVYKTLTILYTIQESLMLYHPRPVCAPGKHLTALMLGVVSRCGGAYLVAGVHESPFSKQHFDHLQLVHPCCLV